MNLLTRPDASAKARHSLEYGWLDYIMYLAPANMSGTEMCSHRTPLCTAGCLNTAGRGQMPLIQAGRLRRTRLYLEDRVEFARQLGADIDRVLGQQRRGANVAVRLNGTSDLRWERLRLFDGATAMERWPELQFYDYSKAPHRFGPDLPSNYHLTFSLAENNDADAREVLGRGGNVAVVFKVRRGQELPSQWWDRPVVDGDLHDLRFLDPPGSIIGLRAKGRAINQDLGFVRDPHTQEVPK